MLHLYTAARGRIGAIAKGSRKPRTRFGGRLEPFFRLDMVLHEGRGDLATVTGVDTVDAYPNLRSSGPAIQAAARGCDAVLRLLDSSEANPAAYNLLCRYLALLDGQEGDGALETDGAAGLATALAFRLKLSLSAGFAPELTGVRSMRRGGWADGVLRCGGRCGLRGVRARRLRDVGRGASVHARRAGAPVGAGADGDDWGASHGRAGDHDDARAPRARPASRRCLSVPGLRGAFRDAERSSSSV